MKTALSNNTIINKRNEKFNHKNIFKRIISLVSVLMLFVPTFGAVVSDNDGSAFITKAEFDSLKNTFQTQIDEYNTSIDNKIDGAIASYLSGISLTKKVDETSIMNQANSLVFRRNLTNWGQSPLIGDYTYTCLYWSIIYANCRQSGYGGQIKTGNVAPQYPSWKAEGTDKDMYTICKTSDYDSNKLEVLYYLESYPVTTVTCNYIDNDSVSYRSSQTALDSTAYTYSGDVWGAEATSISGQIVGTSVSASGQGSWTMNDVAKDTFQYLMPGGVLTDTTNYVVMYDELNKKGTTKLKRDNEGIGEYKQYWTNGTKYGGSYTCPAGRFTVQTYNHDYKLKGNTIFQQPLLSPIMKRAYMYYEGIPMFTASYNGKVNIKLKLTGVKTYTDDQAAANEVDCDVAISDAPFGNEVPTKGVNMSYDADCSLIYDHEWVWKTNKEYELSFKVNKGTTYYIKIYPSVDNIGCSVSSTKIEVESDI